MNGQATVVRGVGGQRCPGVDQMDILGSLKLPPSWYQVWLKLVATQDPTRKAKVRGYIPITQRLLQERCVLSSPSISEATQWWSHIGWIRTARRGWSSSTPG